MFALVVRSWPLYLFLTQNFMQIYENKSYNRISPLRSISKYNYFINRQVCYDNYDVIQLVKTKISAFTEICSTSQARKWTKIILDNNKWSGHIYTTLSFYV